MTKDRTQDQRYINCDEAILDALSELMGETSFETISISRLCAKARVTRATFYRHFPDVRSALDALEDKIFNSFVEVLKQFYAPNVQHRLLFRKLLIFTHREQGYFRNAYKHHNVKMYRRIVRAMYPIAVRTWADTRGGNISRINTLDYYAYAYGIVAICGCFLIDDGADLKLIDKYVDVILEFIERNYGSRSPYIGQK